MSRILVLGGTGMLGEPVVRHLLADGFEVCLLARSPIKVRNLFDHDVDVVAGDLGNRKALAAARFRWDNHEARNDIVYRYFVLGQERPARG